MTKTIPSFGEKILLNQENNITVPPKYDSGPSTRLMYVLSNYPLFPHSRLLSLWTVMELWQNVVHWRREWQTTSVFLPWEPHEQYEKCLHLEVTKSAEEIITINKTKLLDWTKLRPFFNDLNFWKVYIALSFCNHKWLSLKKKIYIYTCR